MKLLCGWGKGGVVRCNSTKGKIYFPTLLFCSKAHFSFGELNLRGNFFDETKGVSSTKACELTD